MVGLAGLKFDFEIRLRNYKSQIEFPADSTVMEYSIIFLTASLAGFISLPACGRAQLEQELLCPPDYFWSFWFFPLSFLLSLSETAFTGALAHGQLFTAEPFSAKMGQ